jgi:hypothetical protein
MHLLVCPVYAHVRNSLDMYFEQLMSSHFHGGELDVCVLLHEL